MDPLLRKLHKSADVVQREAEAEADAAFAALVEQLDADKPDAGAVEALAGVVFGERWLSEVQRLIEARDAYRIEAGSLAAIEGDELPAAQRAEAEARNEERSLGDAMIAAHALRMRDAGVPRADALASALTIAGDSAQARRYLAARSRRINAEGRVAAVRHKIEQTKALAERGSAAWASR